MSLTARKPPDPRLPDPPKTLGEHLLVRRHERGLLQREVAEELDVKPWSYLNWEQDRTRPVLRFLPLIYRWLGYCPVEARPQSLGERLLQWRATQGLSQAEVARRLELDPGTVRRIEAGVGTPVGRVLRAVHELLGWPAPVPQSPPAETGVSPTVGGEVQSLRESMSGSPGKRRLEE